RTGPDRRLVAAARGRARLGAEHGIDGARRDLRRGVRTVGRRARHSGPRLDPPPGAASGLTHARRRGVGMVTSLPELQVDRSPLKALRSFDADRLGWLDR